jgi:hypothetical protein
MIYLIIFGFVSTFIFGIYLLHMRENI